MNRRLYMNGTDYLMSVFDGHLRRMGASGNLSHLCLGVSSAPDLAVLRKRLDRAAAAFPMISARQRRSIFSLLPYWQLPGSHARRTPFVRHLRATPPNGKNIETLRNEVLNDSLDSDNGELIRFTVIEGDDDTEIMMTWAHTLMDAGGGESFLAFIGGEDVDGLAPDMDPALTHTRRAYPEAGVWNDMRQAWQALRWLDHIGTPPPLSIYTARLARAGARQVSRFISFSQEETAVVLKNSSELCGFLGETNYYLAASLMELDGLCAACDIPAENCIVYLPSDARDKGSREPVFSNFSSFIIHYLRKEHLSDLNVAIRTIQQQTRESIGNQLNVAFNCFGKLVRRVPLRPYWNRMKLSLNNEIGSMFFANTGKALSGLDHFLGQEVLYLHHVTSVTAPPGLGVFFHTFKSRLCCTVVLIDGLLSEQETAAFIGNLRHRLLKPPTPAENDR